MIWVIVLRIIFGLAAVAFGIRAVELVGWCYFGWWAAPGIPVWGYALAFAFSAVCCLLLATMKLK
jgi:hypothetical protein